MIGSIFDELDPYLRGIKKAESYSVIEAHLKTSWLIPEHGTILNQDKPTKTSGLTYYMFYSETDSFDKILDWLRDTISMNIETELKEELLKQKVIQLKEVFETSSLDELQNLKFSSESDVLKLGGNSKNNNTEKEVKSKDKSKDDKKTVEA